jgi:glycosyltransferase involved in cell wall biosynthesis
MKVLMISGDCSILDPTSAAGKRLSLQRGQVEALDVFVWPQVHLRREIIAASRKVKYDVVTSQDPFWRGLLAWRIARSSGAILNIQVHTDLFAQPFLRQVLASFVLRRADTIRIVSERIRAYLTLLNLRARVSLLPIYIDIEHFSHLPHTAHLGARKTMLWIGRFEKEKDPMLALRLLEQVRAQGVDACLIMLGTGTLNAQLQKTAVARHLPVEFPGWQDPVTYLPATDVVVSTSRHESYGASVIEALAAGVEVVSVDMGIAKEAGAIIVPRAELAKAIIEVLRASTRGTLKLLTPTAEEWARQWRDGLA